jgi:hypothetical protein
VLLCTSHSGFFRSSNHFDEHTNEQSGLLFKGGVECETVAKIEPKERRMYLFARLIQIG